MSEQTILMYHSVDGRMNEEVGADLYCVTKENFRKQIEYISKFTNSKNLITFDDGNITHFQYVYPLLKGLNLRAYFFIIVSKVGMRGYMNWEQIKELRDRGMIIGSHGMTHKILTELGDRALSYELKASKKFLEDNLGIPVDYFSIPRGFYNKKVISKAKESGYKAVFTSNPKDNDNFKFGRIAVMANWNLDKFIDVVNNGFSLKEKTGEFIKSYSKRLLGNKNYDRLRTMILKR